MKMEEDQQVNFQRLVFDMQGLTIRGYLMSVLLQFSVLCCLIPLLLPSFHSSYNIVFNLISNL